MKLAFLGTGAMGARMAAKLIDADHQVTVWNRTPARTACLVKAGARLAETPRAAVMDAEAVFSMVRDDEASQAVWLDETTGALNNLPETAIGVECSTLSLPFVSRLSGAFTARGRAFLDAPLAGSRPQAEAGQLIFLIGGSEQILAKIRPLFDAMGSATHHTGATGSGTSVKLMVNTLFGAQIAVLAELIGFAARSGFDPARAIEILSATPVASPAAKAAASTMLAGNFAPAFPIELVAKDFDLVTASAASIDAQIPLASAVGEVYMRAIHAGFGEDNITGVAQLYAR
ncbi:MAG: NAD(P)-dependent oxidoreductase [Rhodobacteraceae bacterium]|nr:NAD(P)-dependent oxidoreductase [Paracoccaceae bacterium]